MRIIGSPAGESLAGTVRGDIIYGASPFAAATAPSLSPVASGLGTALFALSSPGDGSTMLVVAKSGLVQSVDLATGAVSPTAFLNLVGQVSTGGEQGLLGMAFHPDAARNGLFYVYLSNLAGDTEVREYRVDPADPTRALPASGRVLLTIDQPAFQNHKGGWLGFDAAGKLLVAVGDGGGGGDPQGTGQNPNDLLGSILRIDIDTDGFPGDPARNYAIPADNPFAAGVGGAPEVWAYGLRNPFRNSVDDATGTLWIGDVGQDRREEVNIGAPGANYGWAITEGTLTYPGGVPAGTPPGITLPLFDYGHVGGSDGSIIGGYVYRGPQTGLQERYIFGDFNSGRVWSLDDADGNGTWTRTLLGTVGSVQLSSFAEDAEGNLYAVTTIGNLLRLDAGNPAGTVDGNDTIDARGGADRIFAGAGDDSVKAGAGDDLVQGMEGNDTLLGAAGQDTLVGGAGADSLSGGTGADQLLGGAGADRLRGGAGADLLSGGAGDDVFVFRGLADSTVAAADRILDFGAADLIDLSGVVAGRFAFIGGAAFVAGNGAQLRVETVGTITRIEGTATGGAPDLLIEIVGAVSLTAADFLL